MYISIDIDIDRSIEIEIDIFQDVRFLSSFWVRISGCGCMSHVDSSPVCFWVYFRALVSGRISVCGCVSQDLSSPISLSLCAPRFPVSVFIWVHLPAREVCNLFVSSCCKIGGLWCGLGCISQIGSLICLCVYVTCECIISLGVFVKGYMRSVLFGVICPSL